MMLMNTIILVLIMIMINFLHVDIRYKQIRVGPAELGTAAAFSEGSYMELRKDLFTHGLTTEVVQLKLTTSRPEGLILWHGQNPHTSGRNKDFIALAVEQGRLVFRFVICNLHVAFKIRLRTDHGMRLTDSNNAYAFMYLR